MYLILWAPPKLHHRFARWPNGNNAKTPAVLIPCDNTLWTLVWTKPASFFTLSPRGEHNSHTSTPLPDAKPGVTQDLASACRGSWVIFWSVSSLYSSRLPPGGNEGMISSTRRFSRKQTGALFACWPEAQEQQRTTAPVYFRMSYLHRYNYASPLTRNAPLQNREIFTHLILRLDNYSQLNWNSGLDDCN